MTFPAGSRCTPYPSPQARILERTTCKDCKLWRLTGENTHTGRQYGECLIEQLTRFGSDAVCSLFEARK